jgi:hypothetical protein
MISGHPKYDIREEGEKVHEKLQQGYDGLGTPCLGIFFMCDS